MSFTSHLFLFYFLPLVLLATYAVPRKRVTIRNVILLVANCLFYGWLDMRFLGLLLLSAVFNYFVSYVMSRKASKADRFGLLVLALGMNLGCLGFFKYALFIGKSLNSVIGVFGSAGFPLIKLVLPIGISFYTFKVVSHVVDTYRTGRRPGSLLNFLCYVSFFPQVLSGPIQRYGTADATAESLPSFAEQLTQRTLTLDRFAQGIALFMLGFAKKILLADVIASSADVVFSASDPGVLDAWFGTLAYTFQLYFDFSGYSDMAIGLGLMLGIACGRNFNAPYRAVSITDFWRRWHVSLSGWFRDYLYIPLGGNRRGISRTYLNLVAVFLLCGLWHGAAWTFVFWGIYHGLLLILERALGRKTFYAALPKSLQIVMTFILVSVGWVFFRSPTFADALHRLTIMFTGAAAQGGASLLTGQLWTRGPIIMMTLCAILAFQPRQGCDWIKNLTWNKILILVILFALALATLFAKSFTSFLYFQF
ncbi:MAG: MBOAT family protein [Sedimentisphaerales bacterium]|nr:MBOAT family protein [Sedimentisphaerales bacterium]